jgi:hypothetical protein
MTLRSSGLHDGERERERDRGRDAAEVE